MGLDNPLHIAFLLVILLLVFGAKRLPEIGRSFGSGLREFKQSISGEGEPPALQPAPVVTPVSTPTPQPVQAQQATAQQAPPAV
jgi:sec-independent protein translocase protein TatA